MDNLLEGKIVIVTGSRRGIGKGCVESLLKAGACVIGCAKGEEENSDTLDHNKSDAPSNKYFYVKCDISDPLQIENFVRLVGEHFGRIDCLVNNAGVHPPTLPIDDFSVNDFVNLLYTNLISIFVACKAALPYLRRNQGSIINMGSAVGKYGQEGATIYCATKGGINAFTKALAIDEAKYGVRANVILPGAILTPSTYEWASVFQNPESKIREIDRWSWLNRQGEVREVGDAVVFLASKMSSYITGHELLITGGTELGYGIKAPEERS